MSIYKIKELKWEHVSEVKYRSAGLNYEHEVMLFEGTWMALTGKKGSAMNICQPAESISHAKKLCQDWFEEELFEFLEKVEL